MDGLLVYGGKTVTAKEEGGRGGEEVGREEKDEEGGRGVGG